MTSSPIDLSHTEKPQQIQENLIAYMRLFGVLPGMTMVDADSFWLISHQPAPGNSILRARWTTDDAEERIDAQFEQIGQHVDQIAWMIFPGDQPDDLGQRLDARGMPGGLAGNWLWADLKTLHDRPAPAVPDDFHIEQVRSDDMLAEWVRLSEAGFEMELPCFYDAYRLHGYGTDAYSLHYTAYLGEIPVTSGTLLDFGGSAAIYDVSTPPAFRHQGFGGALTHALMHDMVKRGYTDSWIWSSNVAKSLYQKLGYMDADFGVREHTWHK